MFGFSGGAMGLGMAKQVHCSIFTPHLILPNKYKFTKYMHTGGQNFVGILANYFKVAHLCEENAREKRREDVLRIQYHGSATMSIIGHGERKLNHAPDKSISTDISVA